MKWCTSLCLAFALIMATGAWSVSGAQDPGAPATADIIPPKPPKPQFFAGQVVEADAEHVKVSRTLLGRAPETRIFVLDDKTKTPKGGVKLKTRVTVRYQHLPEHDLALEIQVRPQNHNPKAS